MSADRAAGGGTRVLLDVTGITDPLWDMWADVMIIPAGVDPAAAVRQLVDERCGDGEDGGGDRPVLRVLRGGAR